MTTIGRHGAARDRARAVRLRQMLLGCRRPVPLPISKGGLPALQCGSNAQRLWKRVLKPSPRSRFTNPRRRPSATLLLLEQRAPSGSQTLCNLFLDQNQAAIAALFRVASQYVGHLAPMPRVLAD